MRVAVIFAILAMICFATSMAQFQSRLGNQQRQVKSFGLTYTNVTAADFIPIYEKHYSATFIVDVREPDEYAAGHIPGAFNLPLSQIEERYEELPIYECGHQFFIHCKGGFRSLKAIAFLETKAARNLVNISDGFDAWVAAGGEVVTESRFDTYLRALYAMNLIEPEQPKVAVQKPTPVPIEKMTRLDYYVIALRAMDIIP